MKTNIKTKSVAPRTHEGAIAARVNKEKELRRSVLTCLLFEDTFYEDGVAIADRIKSLVPLVPAQTVADLALEARTKQKLRHVPLLLVREMARIATHKHVVAETIEKVVQRADEMSELLAIYQKDGKDRPISAQLKKGLAKAFVKFTEFQLGRYQGNGDIKLRDVLFLTHPKPRDDEQAKVWKKLADKTLSCPDSTWEVQLSASKGQDKKTVWSNLLNEGKMGALALLRNLRNMQEEQVADSLIRDALKTAKTERVLPFRFITAARYAPKFEPELETLMFKCLAGYEKLAGTTALMIDVSSSMDATVSAKSELRRVDAAYGVAMLLREIGETVEVYSFSDSVVNIPARRGFALREAIQKSQHHSGTNIGEAVNFLNSKKFDRIIVITDEQSATKVSTPKAERAYMVNVASFQNGVGYGKWTHIDGWSEAVIDYIVELEKFDKNVD